MKFTLSTSRIFKLHFDIQNTLTIEIWPQECCPEKVSVTKPNLSKPNCTAYLTADTAWPTVQGAGEHLRLTGAAEASTGSYKCQGILLYSEAGQKFALQLVFCPDCWHWWCFLPLQTFCQRLIRKAEGCDERGPKTCDHHKQQHHLILGVQLFATWGFLYDSFLLVTSSASHLCLAGDSEQDWLGLQTGLDQPTREENSHNTNTKYRWCQIFKKLVGITTPGRV